MNVLGAVAQGVGKAVFGTNEDEEDMDTAEQLLQRVSEGVLGEDRRQAMQELKDAMMEEPQYAMKIGEVGYPVLVSVLREDKDDLELIKGTLEVFIACIEEQQASGSEMSDQYEFPFGLRDDYVTTILSLLEKAPIGVEDFYVRYYTLQISNMLMQAYPIKLQECVLMNPNTIPSLVSLLGDRELVRNESLLLLLQLCRKNEQVKTLAGKEGAFPRLLTLITEEGGIYAGNVLVMDVLDLLYCLLSDNLQNQQLFRQNNHLQNFIQMLDNQKTFDVKEIRGELRRLKSQNYKNISKALEIFLCLGITITSDGNQQQQQIDDLREENVRVMREGKVGVAFVRLGFMCEGEGWEQVRMHAFRCLTCLILNSKQGREFLAHSVVYLQGGPQSLLLQILRLGISGECKEASLIIQSFFYGNENGQIACVKDLVAGSLGQEASELSEIIISGLQNQSQQQIQYNNNNQHQLVSVGSIKAVCAMICGNISAATEITAIQIDGKSLFQWSKEIFEMEDQTLKLAVLEMWCYLIDADSQNVISNYLLSLLNEQEQLISCFIGYIMGKIALLNGKQITDDTKQQIQFIIQKYQQHASIYDDIRYGINTTWPIDAVLINTIKQTFQNFAGQNQSQYIQQQQQQSSQNQYLQKNQYENVGVTTFPSAPPQFTGNTTIGYQENQSLAYDQFSNLPPPPISGFDPPPSLAKISTPPPPPEIGGTVFNLTSSPKQMNIYEQIQNIQQQLSPKSDRSNGSKITQEFAGNSVSDALVVELQKQVKQQEASISHLRLQVEQKELDIEVAQQEAQQHQSALKRLNDSYQHTQKRAFELEAKLTEMEKKKGYTEEEVSAKIQYEVEKAQMDGEEAMADLLICLGEEEAKVAVLIERLQELGEDPQELLRNIKNDLS